MSIIEASPTKDFFVSMLTRDIDLDDAILDLLDNSLDGLLRQSPKQDQPLPYSTYNIKITISDSEFIIEDNCGGIPTNIAEKYAFRMGKPPSREDDKIPTVGMFGIGMKRAIFKMGKDITVLTKNANKCFYVNINSNWLSNESWDLEMQEEDNEHSLTQLGTKITVKDLYAGIQEKYSPTSDFISTLIGKIQTHYAYIIKKGLNISVNYHKIEGNAIELLVTENPQNNMPFIKPFVYEEENNGVKVKIIVGLTGQAPSSEEIDSAPEKNTPKESHAGWTVICNERVILYADKSRLTGWGDGLPKFHYQFNTIVGIVEFYSNDASKLPITTTKRGMDASSDLYLRIRRRMIEGMRLFVDYTNQWKNLRVKEKDTIISKTTTSSLESISVGNTAISVRDGSNGRISKPTLPRPPSSIPTSRFIRYSKLITEIETVSEFLLDDPNQSPSDVGEACFDKVLQEAES